MRKNLGLKLVSLLAALLLALYVNSRQRNSVISFIVPIEVKNLPEEKIILHPKNLQARITLRGPSYSVSKLATNPQALSVSLPADLKGNAAEVPIVTNVLDLPATVTVDGVEPAKLTLKLDDRVEQFIKLKIPTIGEVSKSIELKSIKAEPDKIQVSGPQSLLISLSSLETTPIDLREVKETTEQEVMVLVPNEFTKLEEDRSQVTITVKKKSAERQFKDLSIEVRAKEGSYIAKPNQATIIISGPLEQVDALEQSDLIPFIRIEEAFNGTKEFKIQVEKPEGLSLTSTTPASVKAVRK